MAKVIHVHLLHKIDGTKQKDWYFSSISAVYTVLTADQVGATKNYLLHAGLSGNGTIDSILLAIKKQICEKYFYIVNILISLKNMFIPFLLLFLSKKNFYTPFI